MRKLSMSDLNRKSADEFKTAKKTPVTIILDNVRSMHNVGSVFRTADAFLMEQIVLCGFTPQPPHRDINKTALGSTETVNWLYHKDILDLVIKLKAENYRIFAVEQVENSLSLEEFSPLPDQKLALIFGNEVDGVNSDALKLCDGFLEIPQSGTKHSLNISVAAGIVLWELFKKLKQ